MLCSGNSCRSQIAEAFLRHYGGDAVEVASAGSEPKKVHPLTIRALAEVSLDISGARSKHLDEFIDRSWDYVITVCDAAGERCPIFPGPARRLHWPFDDPPRAPGPPEAQFQVFRRVRDEIQTQVRSWLCTELGMDVAPS
ncbi:MAG: arsenate reductase ArsC [Ardenticatenaceae bacterium]|nr:arsenate reductase ArsC [Ardenticatenaceae bacterium]